VFSGLITPIRQLLSGRGLPSIHDITTDPDDPPQFSAVLPLRTGRVSPPEYDGPDAAVQQRRAYPDITPLELGVSVERALDEAAAVARELGWDIVAVDRARGVLEAVDTTFWFRFKDDVVVRVRESSFRLKPEATGGKPEATTTQEPHATATGAAVASGFSWKERSRVDVRSKSRVGRGDLGVNARRIRMFMVALRARVPDS
jgi:uncharacterized protein (DUF1499 family)